MKPLTEQEIGELPQELLAAAGVSHPRPFLAHVMVEPRDLSATIDHVNNVQYLVWVDRAAELHAETFGCSRAEMKAMGMMWFVVRHEINYRAEAWQGDRLIVATWVATLERFKSRRETRIIRPRDNTVIADAVSVWVLIDLATRRPTRVTPEMFAGFESLGVVTHESPGT
jgi:acyl-CoA thioester hydrolase